MKGLMTGEDRVSALLSPEDSRLHARPLRTWNHSQVAIIQDACQVVYDTWCQEWGLPASSVHVADAGSAWEGLDDGAAERELQPWLFGDRASGSAVGNSGMASQLGARAWRAWQVALAPLAPPDPTARPVRAWSGGLVAVFPWASGQWCRALEGDTVERILSLQDVTHVSETQPHGSLGTSQKVELVPLNHAIARHLLNVNIQLQPVSLSLAQLQSLSLGDVVTLDHGLDEPALMHLATASISPNAVAAEPPLCTVWLGQVDGRMAVELHTDSL